MYVCMYVCIVAAPKILFREVIQIRVEEVDKDLFVNNFFSS